jgi:Sigma-70 region 2
MTDGTSSSDQAMSVDDRNPQGLADAMCAAVQRGEYERALHLFGQLEELSAPLLLGIAREEGPADEVDELVADTYIGLLRHIEAGKPIGNVKALLRTILKRRIVDTFRRRGGVTLVSADALFGQGAAAQPDALEVYPQADVDDCETLAFATSQPVHLLGQPHGAPHRLLPPTQETLAGFSACCPCRRPSVSRIHVG